MRFDSTDARQLLARQHVQAPAAADGLEPNLAAARDRFQPADQVPYDSRVMYRT